MTIKVQSIKLSEFIALKKAELQKKYTNVRVQSYKAVTLANGNIGATMKAKVTSLNKNGFEVSRDQFPPGATTSNENGSLVVFEMSKVNDLYTTRTEQFYFLWK